MKQSYFLLISIVWLGIQNSKAASVAAHQVACLKNQARETVGLPIIQGLEGSAYRALNKAYIEEIKKAYKKSFFAGQVCTHIFGQDGSSTDFASTMASRWGVSKRGISCKKVEESHSWFAPEVDRPRWGETIRQPILVVIPEEQKYSVISWTAGGQNVYFLSEEEASHPNRCQLAQAAIHESAQYMDAKASANRALNVEVVFKSLRGYDGEILTGSQQELAEVIETIEDQELARLARAALLKQSPLADVLSRWVQKNSFLVQVFSSIRGFRYERKIFENYPGNSCDIEPGDQQSLDRFQEYQLVGNIIGEASCEQAALTVAGWLLKNPPPEFLHCIGADQELNESNYREKLSRELRELRRFQFDGQSACEYLATPLLNDANRDNANGPRPRTGSGG